MKTVETLSWILPEGRYPFASGVLRLIDQTLLPTRFIYKDCHTVEEIWEAIRSLQVRGAPAIGIAAAYGLCIGVQSLFQEDPLPTSEFFIERLHKVSAYLATSRPTAVNLFWALERLEQVAKKDSALPPEQIAQNLLQEAFAIHEEDRRLCRSMGRFGAELIKDGASLLTHCNAGGLATADYGTALGVFFSAHESGKKIHVYADETRPLLQGARLTSWELSQHGIPVTLLCDSAAAMLMKQRKIDAVFVGADRVAANGDTANKIGTYSVAVNAFHHHIPFYVVAPYSTFDFSLSTGDLIPIEERSPEEIRSFFGTQTAPDEVDIYNPAFDVTPAKLITGIVTERGVFKPGEFPR